MATPVAMPQLGNTVESSIIVKWHKKKGDSISEGETLCEIETDKAMMEVPSPVAGTILELFFNEGDDVPVKTAIAAVGQPGEDYESLRPGGSTVQAAPAHTSAQTPEAVATTAPAGNGHFKPAFAVHDAPAETTSGTFVGVSPRARNLAERKGVDLEGVIGSGPGGRIIERDVLAAMSAKPRMTPLAKSMLEKGEFVAPPQGSGIGGRVTSRDLQPAATTQQSTSSAALVEPGDEFDVIPVRGMRKVISERMLASMQTTAQLTMNTSADARALQAYRKRLKNSPDTLGLQKVTINDLVLFAVSRTLLQFPDLNALFEGDSIKQYKRVHLGFAVDTPRGLLVPVIRNAHALSLKQMAAESSRLAAAGLDGKISPDELSGGTFTVTNLGSLGIENFTPILNPPQVAILGVSNIQLKAVESDEGIEFIPHIGLSLTINHQAVDGAPGARFLQALSRNLADLEILLAL
jgi:pyruvate dehydrogenase E2 component (dihydrolipoamide acetyltransferase)